MIDRRLFAAMMMILFTLFCLAGCNGDDDDDDASPNTDDDSVNPDDDTVSDDDIDDDSADDDVEPLTAAAGQAVITPTAANHPETIYLGGLFPSRIATGVHDDLLAAVLVLRKGDEHVVLVSLDFLGFTRSRGREIQERLAAYGIDSEKVLISSTHTHEAPDTLGVFGPNVLVSGVSPTYMTFVQDTIIDLVKDTWDRVEPVSMRAAKVPVNEALSNYPSLIADLRIPEITVGWLSAARFDDLDGNTVATLVNWHSHPEVMIESTEVSADFPRWARLRMEQELGGSSVYLSGAVGGLSTPTGVDVPARDVQGEPVVDGEGNPVILNTGTWDKARSMGFIIADLAIDALSEAPVIDNPDLSVTVEELRLPVQNPIMFLAFVTGLVEFDREDLISDDPDYCGIFGCSSDRLGYVRVGSVGIITSPGETFPETFIGREESQYDFSGEWGVFTFPAIAGIVDFMSDEIPMLMNECGNEIGYLIPESDFHPRGHPDYYEEDLFWGYNTETVYREAAIALVSK